MASQSPSPLKGGATLEGVDYVNLWEESGTGEDKWLLRVTETRCATQVDSLGDFGGNGSTKCLNRDTMEGVGDS